MSAPFFASPSLSSITSVRHGFFGREGGVSFGVYASLNAGPGSGDDPAHVAENRVRIAATLGVAADHLISLYQVHSARVVRVDGPWIGERPQADALVTTTPGVALTALSADCAPVLFADARAGVVGAAHAGWKGALGGVLEACVAEMIAAGADASRIIASIGPCIHQRSYEVGPDFHTTFLAADADSAAFFIPGAEDRFQFDLPGYCLHRLIRAGVTHAEALPLDTYADRTAFHSHRRNVHEKLGDYGRNCAAITLVA